MSSYNTGDPVANEVLKAFLGDPDQGRPKNCIASGILIGSAVNASLSIREQLYGFRTALAPSVNIGEMMSWEETPYYKKVKLVGYAGSQIVFEASTWMKVYREIYYPSTQASYQKYYKDTQLVDIRAQTPHTTISPLASDRPYGGYGSMYEMLINKHPNAYFDFGQYQCLWLRWQSGSGNQRGILFDWFLATSSLSQSVSLSATPTGQSSKSFATGTSTTGKAFATKAINFYGDGTRGQILGNYTGIPGATFYLQDDPVEKTPRSSSIPSSKTAGQRDVVIRGIPNVSGNPNDTNKISLTRNIPQPDIPSTTVDDVVKLPSGTQVRYPGVCVKLGQNRPWEALYFESEAAEEIDSHIKNAEQLKTAQFATTSGKSVNRDGPKQNIIIPNFEFADQPSRVDSLGRNVGWTPRKLPNEQKFLPVTIFDGTSMGGSYPVVEENWIPGYAPENYPNSTQAQAEAARNKYWYVFGLQIRNSGKGFPEIERTGSEGEAKSRFTNPAGKERGLHWGKFLKSTAGAPNYWGGSGNHVGAASVGFASKDELNEWMGNLDKQAANSVNKRLANSSYTAYTLSFVGTSTGGRISPSIKQTLRVSLKNVEGISLAFGLTSWGSQKPYTTGGAPAPEKESDDPADGQNPNNTDPGPPKDWRKIIADSTNKLINPASVQSLTQKQLERFLENQAKVGAPLSLLKEIFFEKLREAKIVSLMKSQNISRKAALAIVNTDPAYAALNEFARGLKPAAPKKDESGGTPSGASNSGGKANSKTIRIQVVRGLPGYKQGVRQASFTDRPELVQTYEVFAKDGSSIGDTKPRSFVFPFAPREVNYTGIGTRWTEIERTGNFPIVDWQGFQLLKISFNFDLADRQYEGSTGFGYLHSCEDDIEKLRQMAQTPYPVTFLNMDRFMENEVRWPPITGGRGIEFVIAEFTVTSVQRTPSGSVRAQGTKANQISRATCSMTLQEIPIENVNIVQMPPIKPCKKKKPDGTWTYDCTDKTTTTEEKLNKYLTFNSGVNQ